jgi:hypothetical protein
MRKRGSNVPIQLEATLCRRDDLAGGNVVSAFTLVRVCPRRITTYPSACANGMSLPPKKGLGLALVEGFAQQIQGRVDYAKVDVGSIVVMCFPVALKND